MHNGLSLHITRISVWLRKYIWHNYRCVLWLCVGLLTLASIRFITHNVPNNYMVFAHSWQHLLQGNDLYGFYPQEYKDQYLYGPFFALLIAPFSMLPPHMGVVCWVLCSVAVLWGAIRWYQTLDKASPRHAIFFWIILNEIFLAVLMTQFNILVAAFMLLSYLSFKQNKPMLMALWIALGLFTKVYGIMGVLLFPLLPKKQKPYFILWMTLWCVTLALLPALFTSFEWLYRQYYLWGEALLHKDQLNQFSQMQNMGFVGMVRKISHSPAYSDWLIVIPAALLQLAPLLRRQLYKEPHFQDLYMGSIFLFVVLFSSGTESNTYIIGYMGIALWWMYLLRTQTTKGYPLILLIGAFIFSQTTSDLMPPFLKNYVLLPYAIKSLFPTLIWGNIIYLLLSKKLISAQDAKPLYTEQTALPHGVAS